MQQSIQDASNEIRRLKQEIITEVPYSGARVTKKGQDGKDQVFFLKSPGYDATLQDDGTVIRRFGFGDQKHLNRYGGFKAGYERLKQEGYRPYGIFAPGVREAYERQHQEAQKTIAKSREAFVPVPEIKKNISQGRLGYESVRIQQPIYYENQKLISPNKVATNQHEDWFAKLDQLNKSFKAPTTKPNILDFNEYANWTNKMNNTVLNRRKQMFAGLNENTRKIQKGKNGVAELKRMLKQAEKQRKNLEKQSSINNKIHDEETLIEESRTGGDLI